MTLKYLRESRKISMRKAGKLIGVSAAQIDHAENGRKNLDPEFILKVITAYEYGYKDFLDFVADKKELPENLLGECIGILRRLKPEKLRTVKAVLESF